MGRHSFPSRLIERLRQQGQKGARHRTLGEVAQRGMDVIGKIWNDDIRRTLAMNVVFAKTEGPTGGTPAVHVKTLGRFRTDPV